jgi:predicted ATPase/DNA-binding SARP family transcriptional activator/class 3 adenylate cyclase
VHARQRRHVHIDVVVNLDARRHVGWSEDASDVLDDVALEPDRKGRGARPKRAPKAPVLARRQPGTPGLSKNGAVVVTRGLPSGVVTFVLSDVVGSTRLWEKAPAATATALGRHDELIADAIAAHGGVLLKARGEGDSTFSVFVRATDAIRAAHAAQVALAAERWPPDAPLSVRFALHTGEALEHDDDYFGPAVNRVARLRGIAGGGQVLMSGTTAALVTEDLPQGARLVELGEVSLRDLTRPETVWALASDGLPEPVAIAPATPTPLRYGVLGPLAIWAVDGTPVRLASEQQRLLLAVLLVDANHTVSADRLIDELWGDQLPTDPRVALRTQVSRLRKRLDDGALLTDDAGYRLAVAAEAFDAARFEMLLADGRVDDALTLWRGDALSEFADRGFAQPEALRLTELRLAAREQRGERLLEIGRAVDAIADLESLLVDVPGRERARGLLMRALYNAGRQTDALEVYEAWRAHLAEDRGLTPSPDLQQLEHQILDHALGASGDETAPAAAGAAWHALPRPASSFVGREDALANVAEALRDQRIVVLCGPGGVGKTRLAVEAARTIAELYPDGVAFCDLSSVAHDADVVRVVAGAVGLEERSTRRLDDQLVSYLEHQHCLLIVDNCEHVINGAAKLVDHLVQRTAGVTILATTREPLAVAGEQLVPVEPLATDGSDASASRLFIDRARSVLPAFAGPGDREDAIEEICRQLDGLPLAIELAAARMRVMTLEDLAGGLDRRFQLLVGARRADERHRSLRAVLDWSYDLLSPQEQRVFDQLAVFASWFDLDAAHAVVGDDLSSDAATDAVLRLVDCSLAVARHGARSSQYAFLDSMRSYGVERLQDRGVLEAARDHHAGWALTLAEDAAVGLAGPDEGAWASRATRHFAEMRTAHDWLVGRDPPAALRPYALWRRAVEIGRWAEVSASVGAGGDDKSLPAALLCAFTGAWQRGDYDAAWELARTAVQAAAPRDPADLRYVVDIQADVAFIGGDVDAAVRLHTRAWELAVIDGDWLQAMWALGSVSHALTYGAELEQSREVAEKSGALAAECGSPTAAAMQEWVVGELVASTDPAAAQVHLERAIELATSMGSRQVVLEAEFGLAIVKARQGDVDGALADCDALLADSHTTRTGILPRDLVRVIEVLTIVRAYSDAAQLYGAAMSPRRSAGRFPVAETALLEAGVKLRSELGDGELGRLAAAGADLDEPGVVAVAVEAVRKVTRK